MGTQRNPWTSDTMGDKTNISGTDKTEDMANVWEITDSAETGHSNHTGHLNIVVKNETESEASNINF